MVKDATILPRLDIKKGNKMLDPRLMPNWDDMKQEMDSYETFHMLEQHLDDIMPNEVIDVISYDEYDEE